MQVSGPVLVVGAGPTGLVTALLLARRGVAVTVLERRRGVHPLPRAVHLDDEAVRILQAAGVADGFATISRAAAGLRLVDARLRPFAEFRRAARGIHGWPESNLFDQPALEELLRDAAGADPRITLAEDADVVTVGPDGVRLRSGEHVAGAAILGCDGAHSTVRDAIGARRRDLGFTERWFVLDVRLAGPVPTWGGVDQVCDPARAATFVALPGDRYRWEFRMRPGEDADALAARVPELVARWTRAAPDILRAGDYTFAARVADRWRDGRTFLLGDAAHLTPPFIGQGLAAGLRDAHNLAWKLAAVLTVEPGIPGAAPGIPGAAPDGLGAAPGASADGLGAESGGAPGEPWPGAAAEAVLDSYRAERAPHAVATIRGAVRVGRAMTGGPGSVALLRRPLVAGALRIPAVRRRAAAGLVTRHPAGPLVDRRRHRRDLSGTVCPQPWPGHDDRLGDGWALLVDGGGDPRVPPALTQRAVAVGARTVLVTDPQLRTWLRGGRTTAALIRPDRIVAATA